jgi:RNA-directed DNA polymerase
VGRIAPRPRDPSPETYRWQHWRGSTHPAAGEPLLDELDTELDKCGHRFARNAAANLSVRSQPAGERVMARVRRALECTLQLTVHETKRAVDRPWNRQCLGCTFTKRPAHRRKVSAKALQAFNATVRALTGRTRCRTRRQIGPERHQRILGGRAFFGCAAGRSPRRALDNWIRRLLWSDPWKPWGRRGSRKRRTRGVSRQLAWNPVTSAHGPWRLRQSPRVGHRAAAALLCHAGAVPECGLPLRRTAGYAPRTSRGVGGREPRVPPYLDSAAGGRGRHVP